MKSYFPPLAKILNPFGGFWSNIETSYADIELKNPRLLDKVHIVYDERYVPHIYAQNLQDALFAQGYVEAQNRLFQMDITARSSSGRLCAVLGNNPIALQKDRRRRIAGMVKTNETILKSWKQSGDMINFQAYEAGINHFISDLSPKEYPFEFKLLNYAPEKWTPHHSIDILLSMAEVLCGRSEDIEHTNLRKILGADLFGELYPDYWTEDDPVIPKGTAFTKTAETVDFYADMEIDQSIHTSNFQLEKNKGAGSNNWAIAKQKSITGNNILANDPHLGLSLPSIWYELHIHTPEFNSYGVSIPGMPGIMIGFNNHYAWGATNVGHDITDFYTVNYLDESKEKYYYGNQIKEIRNVEEQINIRGADALIENVKYTEWGPIIYSTDSFDIAYSWQRAHGTTLPEYNVFIDVMYQKNYDDFLKATDAYVAPAINFAFASKDEIGMRVNGLLPAKESHDGKFIKDGKKALPKHLDFIPKDELPQIRNPERQYVSSANQRSTGKDYPYYYNGYFENFRGRRVNDLLEEKEKLSIEDMKKMQLNTFSLKAAELLPTLIPVMRNFEKYKESLDKLENWDYHYDVDSEAATIFDIWYSNYRRTIFDEIGVHRDTLDVMYPESWKIIELSTKYPDHNIFDRLATPEIEKRDDIIKTSFFQTMDRIKTIDDLRWGYYRPLKIQHITYMPALSYAPLHVGGHGDALNAVRTSFGPSWRMVVELGDEIEAYGVFPGGQSGNPASRYFDDSIDDWAEGRYHALHLYDSPNKISNPVQTVKLNK